ncbi:TetR/AcrR family transcriptional regulator [Arsenicicoccus sp. oral taxon 190]|uniref:TetR/AcrR family transcriptional regulator n=1 Tax=Arsenicicoccus sp. oral taxon 190 TaxID=1658671 RepID=UPI00067A4006|nr:TetR/AcrR family transcriptional regulator [Arsenicicoccus sp. oral taxon 190]AKT51042.1 TetR family transcriptional regulator [Arsenicicoccus sp. oral taxon 190]
MPPGPTRDARHRIKAAALQSFAAKGFHATTTRDIAAAAGMSPAAVYVHHASKESLLHALSLEGHAEVLRLAREAVASADSPTEQLRALVHAWVLTHAELHTVSRIVNYELDALSEEHLAEVGLLRREITEVFRGVVESGLRSGEFETEQPPMTVTALISLGVDVARWWSDDGSWTPQELADHYTTLALRLVRPAAGPRSSRP